jgi:hypothetical protein
MDAAKHTWKGQLGFFTFYRRLLGEVLRPSWGWAETISTVFGIAIPLILRFFPELERRMISLSWEIPVGVLAILSLVRLAMAPYWLYQDRHRAAENEETSLREELRQEKEKNLSDAPHFEVMARHAWFGHNTQENITIGLIQLEIINRGAHSVALIGGAHYESPTLNCDLDMPLFSTTQSLPIPDQPGSVLIMAPSDWLIVRAREKGIPKGLMDSGRVAFVFPGDRIQEIKDGAIVSFHVQDCTGKDYPVTYQRDLVGDNKFRFYPGDKVRPLSSVPYIRDSWTR